ncbi:MAG: class I SAM-dependent methyltransferase, partial [Rickettsiales bacterium]|jgi:hypothetical protein|nr:class I SAM-dependent methyltransferase [Rickettsiales bacterium]
MLNAIKEFTDAKLYSIDLLDNYYKDKNKRTGFIVDSYSDLKIKHKLFTGGMALEFMNEIVLSEKGEKIDFCLIDTVHTNPGEIFDFLMVLPFLKDNAIVVFHDTSLHIDSYFRYNYNVECLETKITNCLLMSSIMGQKILQGNYTGPYFPNIGGIKINKNTKENVFEIFNLLLIKWSYLLNSEQKCKIMSYFEKYYDKYYLDYLRNVFFYQESVFSHKEIEQKNTLRITKKIQREIKRIINQIKHICNLFK